MIAMWWPVARNPPNWKQTRLTLSPHVLVAAAVTGDILRALVAHWLPAASKHVLEEVELGLGNRDREKKSPEGLEPESQHFSGTEVTIIPNANMQIM